jgi:hypothetical protein
MPDGHCLCGQLRFEVAGDPRWVAYCHCASCRRHTGSPVACFVNYPLAEVRFGGERATYHSSPGVTRSHCATCGTPIAYQTASRAGEIDLYVNAFARPQDFTPQLHVFTAERLPWFDTRDLLPRAEGGSAPQAPASRLAGFIIDCQGTGLWDAARFWSEALRLPTRELPGEEGRKYVRLEHPDLHIEVQRVDHPSRVHLDIAARDVEAEVQRLEALGARRIAAVHTWVVMEAPTGQRFCVVRLHAP